MEGTGFGSKMPKAMMSHSMFMEAAYQKVKSLTDAVTQEEEPYAKIAAAVQANRDWFAVEKKAVTATVTATATKDPEKEKEKEAKRKEKADLAKQQKEAKKAAKS